ncbi:hypothetical protein [Photobacterium sp. TY1-4]|uniref:hypothetical protein n=1 Tax=Photobacterium sp. TY1-4 TaxID=2899122 RepID=UPI0021BF2CDD|nr:hypothetical protein [Photobacterium sp. TY1-4]UXI02544.1 hypothetical protein NH461_07205 [Photobacterium sp. TY1-4]
MRKSFIRMMFAASLLSWGLLVAMPVVNAHNQPAGTWASLCTLTGFKLVKLADSESQLQHDTQSHCPIGLFSLAHAESPRLELGVAGRERIVSLYHFAPQPWPFSWFSSRAPPFTFS